MMSWCHVLSALGTAFTGKVAHNADHEFAKPCMSLANPKSGADPCGSHQILLNLFMRLAFESVTPSTALKLQNASLLEEAMCMPPCWWRHEK
jgi:hypothetical protein